jgi:thymidylate synthase (FAD)
LPALEFATIHLSMPCGYHDEIKAERYLQGGIFGAEFIVSGSIRAFMEADIDDALTEFLAHHFPVFFQSEDPEDFDGTDFVSDISFARPEEIPWQHRHVAVRVICSRSISHQLVRHRPCSFLQESQRYCRYDDEVVFVRPEWVPVSTIGNQPTFMAQTWEDAIDRAEEMYRHLLIRGGIPPQAARGVLPNDTKTELLMYASMPEWKHIFAMRCAKAADPEMRRIMIPLWEQFKTEYPEMWRGE